MRKLKNTILIASLAVLGLIIPARAEVATMDESLNVAKNWTVLIVHLNGDWGGSTRPKVEEIQELKRGERVIGYFCNVKPQGFIAMSLRKELAPVKAYSAICDLAPESYESEVIKVGMERVSNAIEKQVGAIQAARTQDVQRILEINYQPAWDELGCTLSSFKAGLKSGATKTNYQGGEVLLSSSWNQNWPYNKECPGPDPDDDCTEAHCRVGCVPLAGAQVMRYWAWPPYKDPVTVWYDWPNMPDVLTGGSDQAQIDAVAKLCHEVGVECGANYCDGAGCATSAFFASYPGKDLLDTFEDHYYYSDNADNYHRNDYSSDKWFELLKGQFNLNRPLPYGIPDHAIVADGWQEVGGIKQYHMNWGHGPQYYYGKTWWYTLDAIAGSDTDEEEVLMFLYPKESIGYSVSGIYPRNASFPYRYFDQYAAGGSALFEAGQMLQFLPGVTVRGSGTGGDSVRFTGSSPNKSHLFTGGDLTKGIRIDNGTIKLMNNGSFILEPLGAPRHLRDTLITSGQVNIDWEKGHGDSYAYEIERRIGLNPFTYYAETGESFYNDTGVSPNTDYRYRVRAIKVGGVKSAYSNEIVAWTLP